jgi:hypothetical protein
MRLLENVGIRADVDHRCGHRLLNQSACFHAIHRPSQLKIQQHQIRPKRTRSLHRVFARIRDRHDGIAEQDDEATKVLRDESLILHDQNAGLFQIEIPPTLETGPGRNRDSPSQSGPGVCLHFGVQLLCE